MRVHRTEFAGDTASDEGEARVQFDRFGVHRVVPTIFRCSIHNRIVIFAIFPFDFVKSIF